MTFTAHCTVSIFSAMLSLALFTGLASSQAPSQTILLNNAAAPNTYMPIAGTGSGGYTGLANNSAYGAYPECDNGCEDPQCSIPDSPTWAGCGEYVEAAMGTFMQLGGRRLDNSASYHNQYYVAKAMNASGLPRDSLFITTKIGSYLPMGGAEALSQFTTFLRVTGLGKADLTLIHWPTCVTSGCESSTPSCQWMQPTYDEKECRLDTWRALVSLLNAGQTRAIGVSNYNETHIQEIIDAGLPLPSVNQCPFNLWHSKDAQPGQLLDFCKQHNILYNGYSPFGVPDRKTYPASFPKTMLEVSVCASVPL